MAGIEFNHKPVEIARQGQEVCIKILPLPGEAPKMFGRHFDADDLLVSKVREATYTSRTHRARSSFLGAPG